MKHLLIPAALCLAACQSSQTSSATDSSQVQIPDSIVFTPPVIKPESITSDTIFVTGDFNGDKNIDTAYSTLYKEGSAEDQAQYKIFFSNDLPDMPVVYGRTRLVNEGDLNGDGTDELSTFSEPLHGCTYSFNVMSFRNNSWESFAEPVLIPTACDAVSDEDLQKRVVLENDTVFVWKEDVNDENFKLEKHPLLLK